MHKFSGSHKSLWDFGHELSNAATLVVFNGCDWWEGLKKDGMCAWFHDGWYNFVGYNSVSLLDTFWSSMYKKNSRFRILILDWTACEINYPSKNEGSKHDKQNSEFQEDGDSEDCFEKFSTDAY